MKRKLYRLTFSFADSSSLTLLDSGIPTSPPSQQKKRMKSAGVIAISGLRVTGGGVVKLLPID